MTNTPPACPGPDPQPRGPLRFIVPTGAVDSHAHVIGLPPDDPFVPERAYTPPAARAADYLSMLDGTGMTYGVLMQISVHGTDNRLMMETLAANRARLKGVAVTSLDQPERAYDMLRAGGVVGLRINTAHRGGVGLDVLDHYGDLCAELAWHLQLLVNANELPTLAPHVASWDKMPNVGELLDLLAAWAPDEATRHRVLVENPRLLYGF